MASDSRQAESGQRLALWRRKAELVRQMLELTRRELLLVDLEGLAPLLDEKQALIQGMMGLDAQLEPLPALPAPSPAEQALLEETGMLVQAVLENESTLEQRVAREQERIRQELRDLELQSRLRHYLERSAVRAPRVDLKR